LIIAAVGIYGVMAYVVALRAREIGVRMALGAQRAQVKRAVLAEAASILGIGATFGVAGAWLLSRYVQAFLFQVQSRDPQLYLIAIAVLLATGLAAAYIPARRASRTDPSSVLRT
ncbi:MAG: FtsX-like permease family protein, partial [Acidobacteriota bacterium]